MTICVTRKLATNIKLSPERLPDAPRDERQRWYANLVRTDRIKYMLVTDAVTLVSVVFPGKGITTPETFADAASNMIRLSIILWRNCLRCYTSASSSIWQVTPMSCLSHRVAKLTDEVVAAMDRRHGLLHLPYVEARSEFYPVRHESRLSIDRSEIRMRRKESSNQVRSPYRCRSNT